MVRFKRYEKHWVCDIATFYWNIILTEPGSIIVLRGKIADKYLSYHKTQAQSIVTLVLIYRGDKMRQHEGEHYVAPAWFKRVPENKEEEKKEYVYENLKFRH